MRQLIVALVTRLLLTCVVEACPLVVMKQKAMWFRSGLVCNVLTNPLLNVCLCLVYLHGAGNLSLWWVAVGIGEAVVLAAETGLYRLMTTASLGRCFVQSLVCNALSFAVGLLWL